MIRRIRAYVPAAFWATFLFVLGGRSGLQGPDFAVPLDKPAHFLLYGVLGALLGWGWRHARRWPAMPLLVALLVLAGACDEWHQRTVVDRSAEVADWIADLTGGLLGFILIIGRKAEPNQSRRNTRKRHEP